MKAWNPYVYMQENFPTPKGERTVYWENLKDLVLALALGLGFTVLLLHWFGLLIK